MNADQIVAALNDRAPTFLKLLGGKIVAVDAERSECTFIFTVPLDFCHSVDVVQGGFVGAMLDAAMSHAAFAHDDSVVGVSTLELTTHYPGITRGNTPLTVRGNARKLTHKTAFLDGEIINSEGEVVAFARSVAKIARRPTS
tara:strand:+ start:1985 stop:2410 length:426 start_codon:yes stop_codon:yes gene_type:complete